MKRLNMNYGASKVVMALQTENKDFEKYIGATARFINFHGRGTYHKDNIFEVVGIQRVWGYNESGEYTMIDGLRLMSLTCKDDFGTPCNIGDIEIISMPS